MQRKGLQTLQLLDSQEGLTNPTVVRFPEKGLQTLQLLDSKKGLTNPTVVRFTERPHKPYSC